MDFALNRFVFNAYLLDDERLAKFAAKVRRRHPRLLFGYASSLYRFAEFVRKQGLTDFSFAGIFSSAEILYPEQRHFIEETFGCRMFNRYGSAELGGLSCECDAHTGMHVSTENNFVEILKNGHQAPPGQKGEIVVTNLNNYGMPFIRYQTEDIGAWLDQDCPCGRALPLMDMNQGRRINLFKTRDGRIILGSFASALFLIPAIKQFQIIQKSFDLVVVRIVQDGQLSQSRFKKIENIFKSVMGNNVQVSFEFPSQIPVRPSGKYLYAICELNDTDGSSASGT
jgi:phenylacetate-CoA ligase